MELLKSASRDYKRVVRNAKHSLLRETRKKLASASKNPKDFWRVLDFKKANSINVTFDKLVNHFKSLSAGPASPNELEHGIILNNVENIDVLDDPITNEEILKAVSGLSNGKAPGPDNVLNEVIKVSVIHLLPFYNRLFNTILDTGNFPTSWALGLIVPIYKNVGDSHDPSNYRGITLVSCLGKLFNKILMNRLELFSELNQTILKNQAGGQKHCSTVDHIFVLEHLIDIFSYAKRTLYVAWVDFAKAYDSVWRDGLWYKLIQAGIGGKVFNVIKDMYNKTKTCVFAHGKTSEAFCTYMGVKQGEVLSSFLFSLFINDIEQFFMDKNVNPVELQTDITEMYLRIFIILYADDLVIVSRTARNLQVALDALYEYTCTWKLSVNTSKTKVTVFGDCQDQHSFTFNGNEIEITRDFKYLGVYFTSNGSYVKHVNYVRDQGRKAMFAVIAKSRAMCLSVGCQIDLFQKMVVPILLYGCEVWGYAELDVLDKLQLDFLRFIFKVKRSTPIPMLYSESGLMPISTLVKSRMLSFYCKLTNPASDTLSSDVFNFVIQLYHSSGYKSMWLSRIRQLFIEVGDIGTFDGYFTLSKSYSKWANLKFRELFISQNVNRLLTMSKCDTYSMYKRSFACEKYLKVLPPDLAISLCKFRLSSHKLEIERMRYRPHYVPRNERFCTKCNSNELSNEYHHILYCGTFATLRAQYIPRKYLVRPNFVKFIDLMSNTNINVMFRLAKFIKMTQKNY